MFGFNPEKVELQPVEIDGTVYVPYHTSWDTGEVSLYIKYERLEKMMDNDSDDNDRLGTDDFRFDP